MNLIEKINLSFGLRSTTDKLHHQDEVAALAEHIYAEMLAVMRELAQLHIEDYDLSLLKTELILPVAEYLVGNRSKRSAIEISQISLKRRHHKTPRYVSPIFVSGDPGIGKTTLLMVLDEALTRLGLGISRDLIVSGEIRGYFADKGTLSVTPLALFGEPTAALSARDWNNILRHWTYDESSGRESEAALLHFAQQLQGKVVIVDEAELEGYVYFTGLLAQHGILVLLSSNLGIENIRLDRDRVRTVELTGFDHRNGDIAKVCLPNAPHELFDLFSARELSARELAPTSLLAGAKIAVAHRHGQCLVYLNWPDLENRPLMKDDFARSFKSLHADLVLLDSVPFFSVMNADDVHLTFLGYLARFVNFVDAIHDCGLPLLVRGTHLDKLDNKVAGQHYKALLYAYDKRVGGQNGHAAWIEWTRCLSRLRSREALNNQYLRP